MQQLLFSVVIPVYNKEPHLLRSINSVLTQTQANFELIIVDDASTDGGLAIIESLRDDRIRVFRRESPGPGGYAARNLGILEARAQWIAFLDADDQWHPDYLAEMMRLQTCYPEAALLSCGWETREGGLKTLNKFTRHYQRKIKTLAYDLEFFLDESSKGRMPVWTSVATVKKSVLMDIGRFPRQPCKRGGDTDTWLRIFLAGYQAAWTGYIGAIYFRDSVNMVTRQHNTELRQPIYELTVNNYVQNKSPEWKLRLKLRRFLCHYSVLALIEKALEKGIKISDFKSFDFYAMPIKGLLLLLLIITPPSGLCRLRKLWRMIKERIF